MIRVLADRNLYRLEDFLPEATELSLYDPSEGIPENARDFDALLVRTVSPVNRETLPPSQGRLQFIATGSAGTDHLDFDYLKAHGFTVADAGGCNANAVAEYVATALLLWQESTGLRVADHPVGIIGVGHVGSALQEVLDQLDWQYVLYDPPREEREPDFRSASTGEVLQCPVLTFHTPLTRTGNHATWHWLDENKLAGRSFRLVINAARGGVVDEAALMAAAHVKEMIIDVWEDEPNFSDRTARAAFLRTPHIAGYSEQAKSSATSLICKALAGHFGLEMPTTAGSNGLTEISFSDDELDTCSLKDALDRLHPLLGYQHRLDKLVGLPPAKKKRAFAKLRTDMPFRNEYRFLSVPKPLLKRFPVLSRLGVTTAGEKAEGRSSS